MPRPGLPLGSFTFLFLAVVSATAQAATHVGSARAQRFTPQIVNGVVTANYPTVGWLAQLDDQGNPTGAGCSGTLIGCQTFLTAAHCMCPDGTEDAASCLAAGLVSPSHFVVFLQNGGFVGVASVAISPDFVEMPTGDIAVVKLIDPVTGIAPMRINTTGKPLKGSAGTIVGYGGVGGPPDPTAGLGMKRVGNVVSSACADQFPDDFFLCWFFDLPIGVPGENSSTCFGDSGGPLFVDFGSGDVLAGVSWGGISDTCAPPYLAADTDVFRYRAFIQNQAGTDLDRTSCGSIPPVGAPGVSVFSSAGQVEPMSPYALYSLTVPALAVELRVTLNGEGGSNSDLYVRQGEPPTPSVFDCADTKVGPFGACILDRPTPGTWYVRVQDAAGAGAFQVTATIFASSSTQGSCSGDCNSDGHVSVDELLTLVDIALGNASESACVVGDTNHDDHITIDEVLAAVNKVLNGCVS